MLKYRLTFGLALILFSQCPIVSASHCLKALQSAGAQVRTQFELRERKFSNFWGLLWRFRGFSGDPRGKGSMVFAAHDMFSDSSLDWLRKEIEDGVSYYAAINRQGGGASQLSHFYKSIGEGARIFFDLPEDRIVIPESVNTEFQAVASVIQRLLSENLPERPVALHLDQISIQNFRLNTSVLTNTRNHTDFDYATATLFISDNPLENNGGTIYYGRGKSQPIMETPANHLLLLSGGDREVRTKGLALSTPHRGPHSRPRGIFMAFFYRDG